MTAQLPSPPRRGRPLRAAIERRREAARTPDSSAPLFDHIDELRRRLLLVAAVFVVAFAGCYWQLDRLFDLLSAPLDDRWPIQTLGVTEPFFTSLSVAAQAAFVIVTPVLAWHLWRFIRPAIEPDARRTIGTLLLVAPALFTAGVVFCYLFVLGPAEMLLHSAAHVAYDGEFEGGTRNLWDIHCLATDFSRDDTFWDGLAETADRHELRVPLSRALRLARRLYGTNVPETLAGRMDLVDRLALRKLHGRDHFGHQGAKISDRLLYIRGHWLRMPPLMLAQHLGRKALRRKAQAQPV